MGKNIQGQRRAGLQRCAGYLSAKLTYVMPTKEVVIRAMRQFCLDQVGIISIWLPAVIWLPQSSTLMAISVPVLRSLTKGKHLDCSLVNSHT